MSFPIPRNTLLILVILAAILVVALFALGFVSSKSAKEKAPSVPEIILSEEEIIKQRAKGITPTVDVSDWKVYTDPQGKYSISVPPQFEQGGIEGFPVFTLYDDKGTPRAELRITFVPRDSGLSGGVDILSLIHGLEAGEKIEVYDTIYQLIRGVSIDGCWASQLLIEEDVFAYVTYCGKEDNVLTFFFQVFARGDLEKYEPIYNSALATFRFGQ